METLGIVLGGILEYTFAESLPISLHTWELVNAGEIILSLGGALYGTLIVMLFERIKVGYGSAAGRVEAVLLNFLSDSFVTLLSDSGTVLLDYGRFLNRIHRLVDHSLNLTGRG